MKEDRAATAFQAEGAAWAVWAQVSPVKHLAHSFVPWSIECEAGEVREKGCL